MRLFWVLGDVFRGKGMLERQPEQAKQMPAAQARYVKSVAGSTTATDQIASAKALAA